MEQARAAWLMVERERSSRISPVRAAGIFIQCVLREPLEAAESLRKRNPTAFIHPSNHWDVRQLETTEEVCYRIPSPLPYCMTTIIQASPFLRSARDFAGFRMSSPPDPANILLLLERRSFLRQLQHWNKSAIFQESRKCGIAR